MTKYNYLSSIYIDSKDRINSSNTNNATFQLTANVSGVDYLAVRSISFLNNTYDITGVFKYSFNSTDFTFSFNANYNGEYSATQLASLLQTQIRSQTSSTTLTVTFDANLNKFIFNTGNSSTMFIYNFTDFARQIGVVRDSIDTTTRYPNVESISFTLPYPVNLTKTQYFDFVSRELTQYATSPITSNYSSNNRILFRLRNNLGFGTTLFEKEINLRYFKYDNTRTMNYVDISVYDDQGNLVDMNNSCYSFEIGLYSLI